MTSQDLIPQFA